MSSTVLWTTHPLRRAVVSLGLALIAWARRPRPPRASGRPAPSREHLIRRHELHRQLEREQMAHERRAAGITVRR